MKDIQISLDSVNQNVLNTLICAPNGYMEKMEKTFKSLEKNEISVNVHTIINNQNCNIKTIEELYRFLKQFDNILDWQIDEVARSIYLPEDRWAIIKPDKENFYELIDYCHSLSKDKDDMNIKFPEKAQLNLKEDLSLDQLEDNWKNRNACSGNLTNFFVLPDGKVTICEELYWHPKFIIGDLTKQSIMEVWNSKDALSLFNIKQEDFREKSSCFSCDNFGECHNYKHICWKEVVRAYGEDNWDYPLPDCPNYLPHIYDIYIGNKD